MSDKERLTHLLLENEEDPEVDSIMQKMLEEAPSKDERLWRDGFNDFRHRTKIRKNVPARTWWRAAMGIAASLFLPLLAVSIWTLAKNVSFSSIEWITASTTYSETSEITLPDGSVVTLKPCSQLYYPEKFFGKQRKVMLSGEAFLEVAHNKRKQFVVSAGRMDIIVHGTRFNVCSFSENVEDEVALLEGSVEMRPHGMNNSVFLAPGELLTYNKKDGSMQRRHFAINYYEEALKSCGLQFENQMLSDIASELTRHFNINVVVDDKDLAEQRYYALFINGEGIDEILSALSASRHFRINRTDNSIHLTN